MLLESYLKLTSVYGDRFDMFTKSELKEFSYFPKELPDAYISLKGKNKEKTKHYILIVFDSSMQHSSCVQRIYKLLQHAEHGSWDNALGKAPTIFIVCETLKQQKALQPCIGKVASSPDQLKFT